MSRNFNNSDLLKELKFKYSNDSVIRFYSRKLDYFFAVHNVEAEKVVELINHLIINAQDQFYVSYYCYQAGMELYITPKKLQSKPYWFNCHAYQDTLTRSLTNVFIPVRIPVVLLESLETLTTELEATKGEIISLALINEFAMNPWMKTYDHDNIIDALASDSYKYRIYNVAKEDTQEVQTTDWSKLAEELKEITSEEAYDPDAINDFIIELKRRYRYKVEYMKDLGEYNNMNYVIKGIALDGTTMREDKLPLNFSLQKLEHLFTQNIDAYRHVYKLNVYDPFIKNDFVYYPTLNRFRPESGSKSCNFSIPQNIFDWVVAHSLASERLRSGMFIQALQNSMYGWEQKVHPENKQIVLDNLKKFISGFKQ